MIRRLALLAGLLTALLLTGCSPITFIHSPSSTGTTVCHEEDACWNCHEMGNRICGPGRG